MTIILTKTDVVLASQHQLPNTDEALRGSEAVVSQDFWRGGGGWVTLLWMLIVAHLYILLKGEIFRPQTVMKTFLGN